MNYLIELYLYLSIIFNLHYSSSCLNLKHKHRHCNSHLNARESNKDSPNSFKVFFLVIVSVYHASTQVVKKNYVVIFIFYKNSSELRSKTSIVNCCANNKEMSTC